MSTQVGQAPTESTATGQAPTPTPPQAATAGGPAVPTPGRPASRTSRAVAELAALDETPLAGHPDIYQRVHAELQGALAEIDTA